MPDICTLALVTVMNATGCIGPYVCHSSADGTKELCEQMPCPLEPLKYDCVDEGGHHYSWADSEANKLPPYTPKVQDVPPGSYPLDDDMAAKRWVVPFTGN